MPVSTPQPETYLSLADLSRKAGVCQYTAKRLMEAGHITPDGFTGRTALFKASRWPELAKAIKSKVIPYARAHDLHFITNPQHPLNLAASLQ